MNGFNTATLRPWYHKEMEGQTMPTTADREIERAFRALCALLATAFLGIAGYVAVTLGELNKNVAVVITKVDNHEVRIHDIEKYEIHHKP